MKIRLKNCSFYAYHGALDAEKELGQRFYIDVELMLDTPAAIEDDDLNNTVHYGEVYEIIGKTVVGDQYDLIETLAHFIGKNICENFAKVKHASVTVRKPNAPINGVFDYVEVCVDTENS